jgi:transcriptional regulator with XRE-family HTH domain
MGRTARERPRRLPTKLLQLRKMLGLTQEQMLVALRLQHKVHASAISGFELGTREPSLLVLLRYARLAGVVMDVLVDDKLDLPTRLPA